jgi:site-specific DNA-methyltransferase (adenine-specific)/modification methylase
MTAPEFLKFTRQWIGACDKVLKDKGSIYIACSYHNIGESMISIPIHCLSYFLAI